jgi:uncharacterized protein (DUF2237 family)
VAAAQKRVGSNATGNPAALAALKPGNNMHLGAQNWQIAKDQEAD